MWRRLLNVVRRDKPSSAPSEPSPYQLTASCPAAPTAGLVPLHVQFASPIDARLVVRGPNGAPVYEAQIEGAEPRQERLLSIHGHLLGEGDHVLQVELVDPAGPILERTSVVAKARVQGGLADRVAASLSASGAPLVVDTLGSDLYDYADQALRPWFDREPEVASAHIDALLADGRIESDEAEALRGFLANGFMILPDVLSAEELTALNAAMDDAVAQKHEGYEWGSSQRLHNLHEHYPAVRRLWQHPKVLKLLDLIFDAPARPCQSLSYVFGSQQDHHQDTIHLTAFPAGYMCGVWTALEDVQPESGELVVYPGTHRLPRIYRASVDLPVVENGDWTAFGDKVVTRWQAMLQQGGFQPEVYRPKAGTVLVWHENLMHAGSIRRDLGLSRRSIVCHYFAEGVVGYYDSTGLPGSLSLDPRPVA